MQGMVYTCIASITAFRKGSTRHYATCPICTVTMGPEEGGYACTRHRKQEADFKCILAQKIRGRAGAIQLQSLWPVYEVETGIKDGFVSDSKLAANMQDVKDPVQLLKERFLEKGLSEKDFVLLSAAYTIGTTACLFMRSRIYDFNSTGFPDPSINATLLPEISSSCPKDCGLFDGCPLIMGSLGPVYEVETGIKDGFVSDSKLAANMQDVKDPVQLLKERFLEKGLSEKDFVLLSAAYTIGTTACLFMRSRIYDFNSTGFPDPSINATLLPEISSSCPKDCGLFDGCPLIMGSLEPVYEVETGRKDGFVSDSKLAANMSEVKNPVQLLKERFLEKGVNEKDLLLLSERTVAFLISEGAAARGLTDPSPRYPTGRTPADLASCKGDKGITGYCAKAALSAHLQLLRVMQKP
ncbi:hypothetical protein SSX86_006356 [Deinandra increscens subsp. villosa]|uniref:peroxidase n=1 Tax=Deinandra increscens subsp. villosa TaxID=3103831 RepID=A0AAP0DJA8_9ASTR